MPPEPLLINASIENKNNAKQVCEFTPVTECVSSFLCVGVRASHLSTKAWWRRNMGSFAEPCTEDMDPFMNTCRAACMPMRELFPTPVRGSPNPNDKYVKVCVCKSWLHAAAWNTEALCCKN